jgi:hypothetical protein
MVRLRKNGLQIKNGKNYCQLNKKCKTPVYLAGVLHFYDSYGNDNIILYLLRPVYIEEVML